MKVLDKIIGLKSDNETIKVAAIVYYIICIGSILGSSDIAMSMLGLSAILAPYIVVKIIDTIKQIKENTYKWCNKELAYMGVIAFIIVSFIYVENDKKVLLSKQQLDYYKSLPNEIEKIDNKYLEYSLSSHKDISKFMDLRVKYEDLDSDYQEFKNENPRDLLNKIEQTNEDINKYYAQAIDLENEVKETKLAKIEEEKKSQNVVPSSGSNNSSSGSGSNNYGGSSGNNSESNNHIGSSVYISNGNRYYHAISNCKYLEGASTSKVTLTSGMDKFECNCFTNPIAYNPPTSLGSSSSSGSSSSGKTVYIASGNSYYHKSPSCKFLQGASTQAVGLNNIGGKHACNCIKY